jgi:anti-anti-sigma regulatory factor
MPESSMANSVASLLVAIVDHAAIVKVNGRANFTTSVSFKRLFTELRDRGVHQFILDLGECITMDSTFLGVLAGSALKLNEPNEANRCYSQPPSPPANPLRLVNPNQRVTDLLENLGISELFRTVRRTYEALPANELAPAQEVHATREELSRTCLEAHQLLMQLNPENVSKFKDVAQFLAEDLKNLGSEASASAAVDAREQTGPTERK